MDLLKDNAKKIYMKFLVASFGSALITSIYGLVDMAMVGRYHGPDGAAAMAVIAPIWNIIYSFGLLAGIGGSILYSYGKGEEHSAKGANEHFAASILLGSLLSLILWVALLVFEEPLLYLFGANESLLYLAKQYLVAVKFTVPVYVFTQIISAFLRNDGNPGLATKAVIVGGILNVFGDYFFVFVLDMGIIGAGIATAIGATLSLLIMLTHFASAKNTLRFSWPRRLPRLLWNIAVTGFSTFFVDIAMGILTMLFNRQIMKYLGTDALAVYGVIVNISTFVQCCAYGVGQAAQPLLSINFGAAQHGRIKKLIGYSLVTVAAISGVWVTLAMLVPNGFIRLFMTPTDSVLAIAPAIIRCYALSFLLLPLNIYATYYFQSIMRPGISFVVSVLRGLLLSGALILLLPMLLGGFSLWLAMPITEAAVAVYVVCMMVKTTRGLTSAP